MARLRLVRHGEASAGFGTDPDPGLSELGRQQARSIVEQLAALEPCPILCSPLRRCRETAAPLAEAWDTPVVIEPAIAEVAAPSSELEARASWLRTALAGTWADLEPAPVAWRAAMLDLVSGLDHDAVLITHFVVINAIIGAATGDDRVMIERLANGSVTEVDVSDGALRMVASGSRGHSEVL